MAHNSRRDVFSSGTAEGGPVRHMPLEQALALPSGDFPGKTVGQTLRVKRATPGHADRVARAREQGIAPVTIEDGVLTDGHHRVAVAASLRVPVPWRESRATRQL